MPLTGNELEVPLYIRLANGTIYRAGITSAGAGGAPSGDAGGDLTGTYPNPTLAPGIIVDADVNASAAIAQSKIANLTTDLAAKVPTTRSVIAGNGLTGGGTLASDATLNVVGDATLSVTADQVAVVSAPKWATGRTVALTGDVTGTSGTFDGSANLSFATAIGAGVIVDADVNASAAIAQSKVASLTTDLSARVLKAGDTMTGNLTVQPAASSPYVMLKAPAGQMAAVTVYSHPGQLSALQFTDQAGGNQRWMIAKNTTAESGGNAGSDLTITAYNDGGTPTFVPITITRSTGLVTVAADPTAALGVATKQYVDGKAGGISRIISSISGATTAAAAANTDYVYVCTAALTLTLPTAVGNKNVYSIKNMSAGTVTVATTSSQLIDAAATFAMDVQYQSIEVVSDNAKWVVIGMYMPRASYDSRYVTKSGNSTISGNLTVTGTLQGATITEA